MFFEVLAPGLNVLALGDTLFSPRDDYYRCRSRGCWWLVPKDADAAPSHIVLGYPNASALQAGAATNRRLRAGDDSRARDRHAACRGSGLELGIYAYDAYILEAAWSSGFPLLALDGPIRRNARKLGLTLVELDL